MIPYSRILRKKLSWKKIRNDLALKRKYETEILSFFPGPACVFLKIEKDIASHNIAYAKLMVMHEMFFFF